MEKNQNKFKNCSSTSIMHAYRSKHLKNTSDENSGFINCDNTSNHSMNQVSIFNVNRVSNSVRPYRSIACVENRNNVSEVRKNRSSMGKTDNEFNSLWVNNRIEKNSTDGNVSSFNPFSSFLPKGIKFNAAQCILGQIIK